MFQSNIKFTPVLALSLFTVVFYIIFFFCILINQSYAFSHDWVEVPTSEYGEQLWDRKSIKRNEDGSVRVLSKFIPKTKSEMNQDILYTMDINCFEKSFRDVDVFKEERNSRLNNLADWKDPNGDKLILGVIDQVCKVYN